MGGTLSTEYDRTIHAEFINSFANLPQLDIGLGYGTTGYIDFIQLTQVNTFAMQGIDMAQREFIVLRGKMLFEDGSNIPFFETFFKRYTGEGLLWMGCGNYSVHLMYTEGGVSTIQKKFLSDLIKNGSMEIGISDSGVGKEKDEYRFTQENVVKVVLE